MSPAAARRYWTCRFAFGVALLCGCGYGVASSAVRAAAGLNPGEGGGYGMLDFLLGLFAFWLALGAVGPLVRILSVEARLRRDIGAERHAEFERATLPRRVFYLLLAVAEADGQVRASEREVVRRFLLERFVDPIDTADLRAWEAEPLPTRDLAALAQSVARVLDPGERATLFYWCCLVAFADGAFREAEHVALQRVARALGIASAHARSLFHLARTHHMERDEAGNGRADGQQRARGAAAPPLPTERAQALAVLDLPATAGLDAIRRRHRELVKRFHPDAQPNLGPVARDEATERFRRIQRAYEILTT